jgi:hypothetical protein
MLSPQKFCALYLCMTGGDKIFHDGYKHLPARFRRTVNIALVELAKN